MSVRVLVTGFEPFGGMRVNPTEQMVRALAGEETGCVDVHTAVLSVEYDGCLGVRRMPGTLVEEADHLRPDAVTACGLTAGRTAGADRSLPLGLMQQGLVVAVETVARHVRTRTGRASGGPAHI